MPRHSLLSAVPRAVDLCYQAFRAGLPIGQVALAVPCSAVALYQAFRRRGLPVAELLTPAGESVREMYALYQAGRTAEQVGAEFGVSPSVVYNAFKRAGLPRRVSGPKRVPADELAAMHAKYMEGASLNALAREYELTYNAVRERFDRRGLAIRRTQRLPARAADGKILPYVPLTAAQIDGLIARATRIAIPPELRFEWRRWSRARQGEFIARLRARLRKQGDRPETPFSANVEPFDYASPRAWEIAARINHGQSRRTAPIKLLLASQGVIFEDWLWFWTAGTGYLRGGITNAQFRPLLHRHLWERAHVPIPPGGVVRFHDGNPNNLGAENLYLATQDDVARENQAAALSRKSRAQLASLLQPATPQNHHALLSAIAHH